MPMTSRAVSLNPRSGWDNFRDNWPRPKSSCPNGITQRHADSQRKARRHAELMKKFPNMEHADADMAHVKPGATGGCGAWVDHLKAAGFDIEVTLVDDTSVARRKRAAGQVRQLPHRRRFRLRRRRPRARQRHQEDAGHDARSKLLDTIKQGDKVKFAADNVNGALTVTAIEAAK